jgi:anaerobic ribonucleoside-triphosphate reductase
MKTAFTFIKYHGLRRPYNMCPYCHTEMREITIHGRKFYECPNCGNEYGPIDDEDGPTAS